MKTLFLILLLAASASATHTMTGRVTDQSGRAISQVRLRLQANYCVPDFQMYPLGEETYATTNTFGYYQFRPRPDCLSYSVRILGGRRHPETGFFPQGYFYGLNYPPDGIFVDREFNDGDFQYKGEFMKVAITLNWNPELKRMDDLTVLSDPADAQTQERVVADLPQILEMVVASVLTPEQKFKAMEAAAEAAGWSKAGAARAANHSEAHFPSPVKPSGAPDKETA